MDPAETEKGAELDPKDIVTMARNMSESLMRVQEIADSPSKPVTIVMKRIENETSTIRYLSRIYLAKIRVTLNQHIPRSTILFVQERVDREALIDEEDVLGEDETMDQQRIKPAFALRGRFHDHPSQQSVYYLCTFQLIDIRSGAVIWEDEYSVKRKR